MQNRIIGTLFVLYDVAAAIHELIAPASLIPSCNTWPDLSSR